VVVEVSRQGVLVKGNIKVKIMKAKASEEGNRKERPS